LIIYLKRTTTALGHAAVPAAVAAVAELAHAVRPEAGGAVEAGTAPITVARRRGAARFIFRNSTHTENVLGEC